MSGTHFQCEFNGDVCFVIGIPDLAIISGMLIWSISYISGTHFLVQIQQLCLFCHQTGYYFRNAWYRTYHMCLGLIFQLLTFWPQIQIQYENWSPEIYHILYAVVVLLTPIYDICHIKHSQNNCQIKQSDHETDVTIEFVLKNESWTYMMCSISTFLK